MKKSSKPNLSRKGVAKNKKGKIIIVLIITILILLGLLLTINKKEINYNYETKYYKGELYSLNHAANMIDYITTSDNIIISPYNVNSSLAFLYNVTDNNSNKEIKKYFGKNIETIADDFNILITENKKNNKYTKLYTSYVNELYDNNYDILTISNIELLSKNDQEELVLLLKKIELLSERINNKNNFTEKAIKNYKLAKDDYTYNSYTIKQKLDSVLDGYETYKIENKVTNFSKLYLKNITKKDLNKDLMKNTNMLENIDFIEEDNQVENIKNINNNIKEVTSSNIMRILEEEDVFTNNVIMINNLHFNYKWDKNFKKSYVVNEEFYNSNETIGIVEMMYDTETIYLENQNAKGFVKNFENNKYSFIGILPTKAENIELSKLDLDSLLSSKKEDKVIIGLPKFSIQYEANMKKLYSFLGINEIFTEKANFTKLTDNKIKLDKSIQKISLNIGEKGTENSYINKTDIDNYALDENEKQVILNRPFAFVIVNNETEEVLLIGKINNLHEGS